MEEGRLVVVVAGVFWWFFSLSSISRHLQQRSWEDTWQLWGATARNLPHLSLIPLRRRWPMEETFFPASSAWQRHGQNGVCVVINRPASLTHGSCSRWWVCILCRLSACNIHTACFPPPAPPPHIHTSLPSFLLTVCPSVFFFSSVCLLHFLRKWWILLKRPHCVFQQRLGIHAWI